ncbi:MAG: hypothetical protein ABIF19_05685 [Planctomycetota bacterium]
MVAEEEFEKSVEELIGKENTRIEGRALFKRYLERCKDLARSDHVCSRYGPNLEVLVKRGTRGTPPAEEELEEAKLDMAIIEFYRHVVGPHAVGGLSPGVTYPDWQSAIVGSFETKERYLQAIGLITKAHKNILRSKRGLDSYLNVFLKMIDACERARERMFDSALIVGRYNISSELWEQEASEFKLTRKAELNRALGDPTRIAGFVYINREGDLVHSYRFASIVENSIGETITSEAGDLSPVLLVPHTFTKHLGIPVAVALVYFGNQQQRKLTVLFQSKSSSEEPDNT